MVFYYVNTRGDDCVSEVLSTFTDNNETYVVVRVGRGPYDFAPPFAVMNIAEGKVE